jgi:YesN/AraC family two-component response regulator
MYKVIIVDDEPKIVEGLQTMAPWDKYGCEVVCTAGDGDEALDLIKQHRPDILLTDIMMPNKDGLALIAVLKTSYPRMQITVLTAYRNIEYAQTAIRLGVARYLLKPSRLEEIEDAIAVMASSLGGADSAGHDRGDAGNFIVDSVVNYINEHYTEKITLEDMAERVFVSRWYLSRLLRKHLNQGFSDLLNGTRVHHAKLLLREPALKIRDVAEMVGLSDVAHFSKIFKKHASITANEYRNRYL